MNCSNTVLCQDCHFQSHKVPEQSLSRTLLTRPGLGFPAAGEAHKGHCSSFHGNEFCPAVPGEPGEGLEKHQGAGETKEVCSRKENTVLQESRGLTVAQIQAGGLGQGGDGPWGRISSSPCHVPGPALWSTPSSVVWTLQVSVSLSAQGGVAWGLHRPCGDLFPKGSDWGLPACLTGSAPVRPGLSVHCLNYLHSSQIIPSPQREN